ncbi:hypothetical protein LEP1GSC173_2324 [Leptospira interrogans str. HAI1594]|uniref:Uncharacterized protein n=1 Tax=Leptospira interrogans serovar Hardjo str. Norma TaxID=1279460 RepID=A0A0M4NX92_LEPIR|nr:hypothetical protein G436_2781 [Leptospira interrogans serovar Hardjo str. Norma]EKP77614.1 hypothetical protein LEP1GSC173_2324 [Leptospira interrogans str. HAI1594]EKP86205.1 hypothetical protein LEP1GSC020_1484 [Leptospira interrogans serovar Grippotyphosa str. 2006006986]EMO17505.1 hypothetical protein LEP1GSC167_0578 [Leptospira interrogans serovar Copenhageni str. HAI0188]
MKVNSSGGFFDTDKIMAFVKNLWKDSKNITTKSKMDR